MTTSSAWYATKYPQVQSVHGTLDVDSTNVVTFVTFKDGLSTEGEGETLETSVANAVASHTSINK